MAIRLDQKKRKEVIISTAKPLLYISSIVFVTTDKNWVQRLFGSFLTIKFACIDKDNHENKTSQEPLLFGTFITPDHIQPVLEINRIFYFADIFKMPQDDICQNWQTTVEINNLAFSANESLEIFVSENQQKNTAEDIIREIEKLNKEFNHFNFSTQMLLQLIPHFRLDWSLNDDGFSEEFNIGATKPILLSGLANTQHRIKSNNLLFENNKITKLLGDTFFIEKKLSVSILKEIHGLIIKDGGQFRNQAVTISDRYKIINAPFAESPDISSDLNVLVNWYNTETVKNKLHPLFISSIFHYNIVRIHPFMDGNGRLARIITSLILLSHNIPPPVSKPDDRPEYLHTLRSADSGDIKPLIIFIGNRIIQSMNDALLLKHSSDA